ncbi:hybrid sensor histidine kinase/response regulator [Roseibium sp. CAU 1637]|uniref:histidine kinase n=1 Tax=Roseibium limicola TaxID=2816037 RepID=A0A939EPW1_9HYPH|nr:hybrid sensor histidine kinase/response regulator [Roseibium limicola]MBO0346750.1 hybrid sensor histidine kinase/response regulator [Roseibium limicola]
MKSEERLSLLLHDLRTPLSAMRLTADLIAEDGLNDRQAQRMDLMVGAIDALLDLTRELEPTSGDDGEGRSTGDPHAPEARAQDGARLIRDVVALFQARADQQDVAIAVDEGRDAVRLNGSLSRVLRRTVSVLLDNALNYAGSGDVHVSVAVVAKADEQRDLSGDAAFLQVIVRDHGPGVEPGLGDGLFKPYVRGGLSAERAGGQGLGLYGARTLLREHGGELSYRAPVDGSGAVFEVSVPLAPENLVPVVCDLAAAEDISRGCGHVMIIDDNGPNRQLLSAVLQSFAHSCDVVGEVETALTLLDQRSYDGFIVDLHMPGGNGIAFAHALKTLEGLNTPPVLLVTAGSETFSEDTCREAGITAIVRKPVDPAILYEATEVVRTYRERIREGVL